MGFDIEMSNFNIVTFSSLEFIFRFLPFFLIVFYLSPSRYKKAVLLLAGLLFYAMGAPVFLPLLLLMTVLNYLLGKRITRLAHERLGAAAEAVAETGEKKGKQKHTKSVFEKRAKRWMVSAAAFDAGVLVLFKVLAQAQPFLAADSFWGKAAALGFPLGLSFYIFKMISYQADCYHGRIHTTHFMDTAVYFCFFPQLVSGPIMRFKEMEKLSAFWQMDKKGRGYVGRHVLRRLENGMYYFTAGLGAKVLLADRLGILWHELSSIGYESISTPLAWLGAFAYSLQLYFDFAGYSLMASGIGVMLGLPFVENFSHPYASGSVREFFRRWHMTLGSWFRDYVYIPLGGNRKGLKRCILNLAAVWLLTGLWHGGTVNFVLWGAALFVLIAAEKLFFGKILAKHRLLGTVYLIVVMPVTWMLFAITDFTQLGVYLTKMFPFLSAFGAQTTEAANAADFLKYGKLYAPFIAAAIFFCIPQVGAWFEKRKRKPLVTAAFVLVFWVSIYMVTNAALNPFLYFSF